MPIDILAEILSSIASAKAHLVASAVHAKSEAASAVVTAKTSAIDAAHSALGHAADHAHHALSNAHHADYTSDPTYFDPVPENLQADHPVTPPEQFGYSGSCWCGLSPGICKAGPGCGFRYS